MLPRLILQGSARTHDETRQLATSLEAGAATIGYIYSGEMNNYLRSRGIDIEDKLLVPTSYHLINVLRPDIDAVVADIYQTFPVDRRAARESRAPGVERVERDIELNLSKPSSRLGTNFDLKVGKSKHKDYKLAMKCPSSKPPSGKGVKIAIVDSGVDPTKTSVKFYDVTANPSATRVDGYGHGTAMASIISDIADDAEIHAVRVTDNGKLFVWELMAGISTATFKVRANIINLSLGCTDLDKACSRCGGYGGGRSTIFKDFIDLIQKSANQAGEPDPLFVSAVGNSGLTSGFEWPARFDNVLSTGALTDAKDRSSFSNTGTIKTKYVMCPGGEWDDAADKATEWVGEGKDGNTTTHCVGTSPATAYAVAPLALYREHYISDLKAKGQVGELSSAHLLDKAINNSVQDVTNYKSNDHGKGRFVYDP